MKQIKDELQTIIIGNGQDGFTSQLKKVHNFLRGNEKTGSKLEEQKRLKSEEEQLLISFAQEENLIFSDAISDNLFISEGAEQRVYCFDDHSVIKLNGSIFYEYWLDYFNSLLIHNYFFKSTLYEFLVFKVIEGTLFAVVKQDFILATETTDLNALKVFLEYNQFTHIRNNDYYNTKLGIIFEDLHDENVLCRDGLLYFIDTVFYLTPNFYEK
ncbi:hypothetical protein [Pedobacter sp. MC2016-24]|uniref:putative polyvalent protein kinase domain-containing protein n=1 Tax=Pedobacter sp. MC2016-24 TaxID=2780090 RepID=UPI00187EC658|nr:hypothetical protein [Pedobacter sp. MC2016-24]MBE9601129.1 hypothetical protein [Pedobacter sp. MC2016-24]